MHNQADEMLSTADDLDGLPPPGVSRWVVRWKAAVVRRAPRDGRLSLLETIRRYNLTVEELLAWERALDRVGVHGLRVTRLQIYDELRDDTAENGVPKAGFIEAALRARRSMEEALGDLVAKHESHPTPDLARMIRQLEIEHAVRSGFVRLLGGGLVIPRRAVLFAGRRGRGSQPYSAWPGAGGPLASP